MIEVALREELRHLVNGRMFPLVIPEGVTQSAIVYQRISTRRYPTFEGDAGLITPRIQLDIYAPDYGQAKELAQAVVDEIESWDGTIGTDAEQVTGASALPTNEFDAYEPDTKRYRVMVEVEVTHKT